MGKTTEKYNELLKLLNNCRQKMSALSDLFVSCVLSAGSLKDDMVQKLHKLSSLRDDLVGVTSAIATTEKENRARNNRVAMPKIKEINAQIKETKDEFDKDRRDFKEALDKPAELRATYKKEIAMCCNLFKDWSQNGVSAIIEKGYKQQVKIIRSILDKINTLISKYNKDSIKIDEEIVPMFNKLHSLVGTLVEKHIEVV